MTDSGAATPCRRSGPAWHAMTPGRGARGAGRHAGRRPDRRRGHDAARQVRREQVRRGGQGSRRWKAFLRQYRDPMQLVLLGAGIVSMFLPGQFATGVVLVLLTVFNAVAGPEPGGQGRGQRRRAPEDDGRPGEGAPERGDRDGRDGATLVPGDVINIEAGDLVPADGRIVRAATLEIDESALTGESAPVPKQLDAVKADAGARATASTWRS